MSGPGYVEKENPQQCDFCGKIRELRPYGPNGECLCFECGMLDEEAAKKRFQEHVLDALKEEE